MTIRERYRWVRGLLRKSRSHDGKVAYGSRASAEKAKIAMTRKTGRQFDIYRCLWGRHFHIGGTVRYDSVRAEAEDAENEHP